MYCYAFFFFFFFFFFFLHKYIVDSWLSVNLQFKVYLRVCMCLYVLTVFTNKYMSLRIIQLNRAISLWCFLVHSVVIRYSHNSHTITLCKHGNSSKIDSFEIN